MPLSGFALTPAARVALEILREERPEVVTILSERLTRVLSGLAPTCQGRVVMASDG